MNHKHSWELIPWYVNGTLTGVKRDGVQFHLDQCPECRAELESQRALLQAMRTRPSVETMPHASLQKLFSRIDAHPVPSRTEVPVARSTRLVGWLAAAVVVQALLLGALSMALLKTPRAGEDAAAYRTVSSQVQSQGTPSVRAVFSPAMTLGELQALLERTQLRIVNGPSPDGVYALATVSARDDPKQALLALRAHPAVKFAEPVGP